MFKFVYLLSLVVALGIFIQFGNILIFTLAFWLQMHYNIPVFVVGTLASIFWMVFGAAVYKCELFSHK